MNREKKKRNFQNGFTSVCGGKMELLSLRSELQDYKPWQTSIIRGCETLMLEMQLWFLVI